MQTDPRDAQIAALRELCKLPQPNTHQVNREMATGLRWALDERDALQAENARLRVALESAVRIASSIGGTAYGSIDAALMEIIFKGKAALAAAHFAKQEPKCKL